MTETVAKSIEKLLNEGFSLIAAKSDKKPCENWQGKDRLSGVELLDQLFKHNTECVAVKLGSQSLGMVCVDLDEKHNVGFSKRFFDEFKVFFPELWEKVRVERTPSGGFHIFYRLEFGSTIPPTKFIGYRALTDTEKAPYIAENDRLKAEGKKTKAVPQKTCFLEIRGEGGLCQTSPSVGYEIVKGGDSEIPVISEAEHLSVETFCYGFNEFIVQEREIKVNKADIDYYSENPFEHFDNSERASQVLREEGWKYIRSNGGKDYYSKPGRKNDDVDAWYNPDKKFYNIFSTNCGIDAKGYSPSNMLATLKFGGDKKQTYSWLVFEGFGKINPREEEKIIKRSVLENLSLEQLPRNISEKAKEIFVEEKSKRDENYPYGTFWEIIDEKVTINMELLLRTANGLGFRLLNGSLVRINFDRIEKLKDVREFFDYIKDYMKCEGDVDVLDVYERFLHTYAKTVISRLKEIPKSDILRSTKKVSYKFFQNCFVRIDNESCEVCDYSSVEGKLIMDEDIAKRDFNLLPEAGLGKYKNTLYYDFLTKAVVSKKEGEVDIYLMKCLGFLCHKFKDEESYFILAIESCEEAKYGGGSGKNVFFSTLNQTTSVLSISASQIKTDAALLQSWNGQSLFVFADMDKKFGLMPFKDLITDGALVKKLYKDEFTIPVEDSPKLCGSSNYSPDITDPGLARRVRQIELSDFFTKAGGVREYYNKMFCKDWSEEDFHYYDNFIIECIQVYLLFNGKIDKVEYTTGGWNKQFDQKYSHLREFYIENIENWKKLGFVSNITFQKSYDEYCRENKILKPYSSFGQNLALESFCEHYKIKYQKNKLGRENTEVRRGKIFGEFKEFIDDKKDDMPF